MLIGLTGGIASGKSTASGFLRELGVEVIDADRLARLVVAPGGPALEEIREAFGPSVLLPDGSLDRPALAARVFGDEAALSRLNRIVHPRVEEEAVREIARIRSRKPGAVIVYDVPLLYEGGMAERFDRVVVIYVPRQVQVRRLRERDRLTEEQALARLASQMDIEEKARRADFVVDNRGSREELRRNIELWLASLGEGGEN